MTKKIFTFLTICTLFFSMAPVNADSKNETQEKSSVIYLGQKKDPASGNIVEGYAFIRYKKDFAKKIPAAKPPKTTQCYAFLASGAKWKNLEPWVFNTENSRGLETDFLINNINFDIAKWENASGFDILGSGSATTEILSADDQSPDGQNEIYFGNIADADAIAITIIWGIFGGAPKSRQLLEWDMIFDDYDFDWSKDAVAEPEKMDFENIATHELGHAMGLEDLYTDACNQESMYGYATEGEILKRTLNSGDILGINTLY